MTTLTQQAHEAVSLVLRDGDIAIDFTAGNGWDTLFLARCVGSTGTVYAFDIQSVAIQSTSSLLIKHGVRSRVVLENRSHADWIDAIPSEHRERIQVGMMNLGYLPSGDKSITTQLNSTIAAIQSFLEKLLPSGMLSILAYTGHPGGREETDAVRDLLMSLDPSIYQVNQEPARPNPASPILFLVGKVRDATSTACHEIFPSE